MSRRARSAYERDHGHILATIERRACCTRPFASPNYSRLQFRPGPLNLTPQVGAAAIGQCVSDAAKAAAYAGRVGNRGGFARRRRAAIPLALSPAGQFQKKEAWILSYVVPALPGDRGEFTFPSPTRSAERADDERHHAKQREAVAGHIAQECLDHMIGDKRHHETDRDNPR